MLHETPQTTTHGVKVEQSIWADHYEGTGKELIAAGLVTADQLPGAPGQNTTRVTFGPDGSKYGRNVSNAAREVPGCKLVRRISRLRFKVRVIVSEAERERRQAAQQAAIRGQKTGPQQPLTPPPPMASNVIPFPSGRCRSHPLAVEPSAVDPGRAEIEALSKLVAICTRTAFDAQVQIQEILGRYV